MSNKLNLDRVNQAVESITDAPDVPNKGFHTFSILRDIACKSQEFNFWVNPVKNKDGKEYMLDKRFDYLNMIDMDNLSDKEHIVTLFLQNIYDKSDNITLNKWKIKAKTRECKNVFYTGGLPIIPLLNYNVKIATSVDTKIKCNVSLCDPTKRIASIKNKHELINNNLHVVCIKNTMVSIINNISGTKNSQKYPDLQELIF